MVKVITLIPTHYNNGKEVEPKIYRELETEILKLVGGFSVEGTVEGGWVDSEGNIYRDKSQKYSIITHENKLDDLKALIIKFGRKLDQRAMYYEVEKTNIDFIEIK